MNWDTFDDDDWAVIHADTEAQKDLAEALANALETCWSLPYAALLTIQEAGYIIVPKDSTNDPR